jgi:hypothetical protein
VKEDNMGGACSMLGGGVYTVSRWENLKQINHREDLGAYARIIIQFIFEKYGGYGLD